MRKFILLLSALTWAGNAQAQEHEHSHPASNDVGSVKFPVSCNAEAQARMNRAVAMLHSFWFSEGRKTFESVVEADPGCGIAYWGAAVTQFGNPMGGGSGAPAQKVGLATAEKGLQIGARTAHDSAYINAAIVLFRDNETLNNRARMQLYEKALGDIVAKYPNDEEARIFHSIMLVATASPTDLTFAQQKKAAEFLTALYVKKPQHPGLAHYIIHAFDAPPMANNALKAARQYAQI